MTISVTDCKIFKDEFCEVQLWYVRGHADTFYPTKIVAEIAARYIYPGQDTNAHVMYKVFEERN